MTSKTDTSIQWIIRINSHLETLKPAERKGAEYILEHWNSVSNTPVAEVARAAGCSEATIVRLAKRLGYKGFPHLKREIQEFVESGASPIYSIAKTGDRDEEVLKKVLEATIQTLEYTFNAINLSDFEQAVDALARAHKIVLIAIGNAVPVALTMHYQLLRLGLNCIFFDDPDMALVNATYLQKGDVAIAISSTGRNVNTLKAAEQCKEAGVYCLVITKYPQSPLGRIGDIVFSIAAFAESIAGDVIAERIAQSYVLESLHVALLMRDEAQSLKRLKTVEHVLLKNHV